jgi:hypothetical protein
MRPDLKIVPEVEIAHRAVIKRESLVSLKTGFLNNDCGTITSQDFRLPDFEAPKSISSRLTMK